MTPLHVFQVEKPWGNFRQFTHNSASTVKIITVTKNETLSLQSHTKRAEFWHVIFGSGTVQIDNEIHEAKTGDEYTISVGSKHRLSAADEGLTILEISTGDFDESDITRYEDKYGRTSANN